MQKFSSFAAIFFVFGLVSCRTVPENGEEKRLIQTSEGDPGVWMTEDEIFGLIRERKTFMDITDFDYSGVVKPKIKINAIPTTLKYQREVNDLVSLIKKDRLIDFVRHFSSYYNRYYTSNTGRESQTWLFNEVNATVANYSGKVVVREVDHGYRQRSIVARLEGTDTALVHETVILGAHLDSVNRLGPTLAAPGADDNGSGSVVLLETLRNIIASNLTFKRTVEFQWYAAEEVGLRGSQAIAEEYKKNNTNVVGMLNLDVIGYHVDGVNAIAIYTDFAHQDLIRFLRILTMEYLEYGYQNNHCGYGCSDHASWDRNGFPAVFAGEAIDHPGMHTLDDTIQNMDFDQVIEFIKLAMGYVVELAEPTGPSPGP